MTPEEAVREARFIARRLGRHADEVESQALYDYVIATRSYEDGHGCSLKTYAKRRMAGAPREVLRKVHASNTFHGTGDCSRVRAPQRTLSEPEPILRRIARITSRDRARAAWFYWGLDCTLTEVGKMLGVSADRAWQLIREVKRAFGVECDGKRRHHVRTNRVRQTRTGWGAA